MRELVKRHPGASVFGLLVALFVLYEIVSSFVAYTADAFVVSDILVVSPQIEGPILRIAVERNQRVAAGDLLFEIDPEPFGLQVAAAQAALALARANHQKAESEVSSAGDAVAMQEAVLADARLTYQRLAAIVDSGAVTQQRVDDAKSSFDQATAHVAELRAMQTTAGQDVVVQQAQIAVAEAALAEAQYNLDRTRIVAASAGVVAPYTAKVGDYAKVATPVMAIVADDGWRLVANLQDYYLPALRPGQPVWVHISTDPWRIHRATVRSVPRGVSREPQAVNVLPYVKPTTEWIRLPRRFPVEIEIRDLVGRVPLFSGADARILTMADTFRITDGPTADAAATPP